MGSENWSTWTRWNKSMQQTLDDAQKAAAGEETIATVRELAGEDGTCSVLDVYSLDKKPDAGACWVLSPSELHQHFGSKVPTRKAIDAGIESFLARLERGQAVAVTAHARGTPSAVLFAGWSVD